MPGPPPKPTLLRIASDSHLPINRDEPQPSGKANAPAWLTEKALKYWHHYAPRLEGMKLLTSVDGDALAIMCQALQDIEEATAILEKDGKFIINDKGRLYPHPAEMMRDRAHKTFVTMSGRFGFTPADRTRIKVGTTVPDNSKEMRMLG